MHKRLTPVAIAAALGFAIAPAVSVAPALASTTTIINGHVVGGYGSFGSNGDFGNIGSANGNHSGTISTTGYASGGSVTGNVNANGKGTIGVNVWAGGNSGNISYAYGPGKVTSQTEAGGALSGNALVIGGAVSGKYKN